MGIHCGILVSVSLLFGCTENSRQLAPTDDVPNIDGELTPSADMMTAPDASVVADVAPPLVDQDVLMETDTDLPADMNAIDMALIDAQPVVDAEPIVDAEPPTPIIPCNVDINFSSPTNLSFHRLSEPASIIGNVVNADGEGVAGVSIELADENNDVFDTVQTNANGVFSSTAAPLHQGSGLKLIRAIAQTEAGICEEVGRTSMFVCASAVDEDFTTQPEDWTLFRNASWEPGGWLEMTGTAMGRAGAAYNTVEVISSGLASIEFTVRTGGGQNGGADGFAFTIVEVASAEQLVNLLNAASTGGGLGYGVGGAYQDPDFTLAGDALTVEIDTWKNQFNGTSQRHTDPTEQNHIAITQNADPGDHLVWFPVPNIEDLQPHVIRLDLLDGSMRISFDGELVIEQDITFAFKGGYMFFSGSTGWATNFHRVDDLRILHDCR